MKGRTTEYFVIIDRNDLTFLDNSGCTNSDLECAEFYKTYQDAKKEKEKCDFPEDFMIYKVIEHSVVDFEYAEEEKKNEYVD